MKVLKRSEGELYRDIWSITVAQSICLNTDQKMSSTWILTCGLYITTAKEKFKMGPNRWDFISLIYCQN